MSLSMRSSLVGQRVAFQPAIAQPRVARVLTVDAKKVCDLTGKKRNKANAVCFSNKKNRKWQEPNLQQKKFFWAEGQRWVKLKVCTKAIKTLEKNGLVSMAAEANIDLWSLPFEDARPQRKAYLAENQGKVPVAQNSRAMKNAEKLAASKKQPRYPVYEQGGRIVWIRPGMEVRPGAVAIATRNGRTHTARRRGWGGLASASAGVM
jgi:large subunit ribosomal protein L28